MGHTWDEAITFLGSTSDGKSTSAQDVFKDDKPWIDTSNTYADDVSGWQTPDGKDTGVHLDSWVAWYFQYKVPAGTVYNASYVVGCHILYPNLDGAGGKLAAFTGSTEPFKRLYKALPRTNDRLDVPQFEKLANLLLDVMILLDGWIKEVEGFANTVAKKDSDWQGSAAGAFRAVLMALRNELDADNRNITQGGVGSYLLSCRDALNTAFETLNTAWEAWFNSTLAWPTNCVTAALMEGLKGATLDVKEEAKDVSFNTSRPDKIGSLGDTTSGTYDLKFTLKNATFGDPKTTDFWKAVEKRGREIWLQHVADVLDKAAETALTSVGTAYGIAAGAATPLDPFPLIMPKAKDPTTDGPGGKDDPNKKDEKVPDPKIDNLGMGGGGGGGPQNKSLGGGPDLKNLGLDGNGTGGKGKLDLTGGGSGSGGSGNHSGTTGNTGLDLIGNPGLGSGGLNDLFPGGTGSGRPTTVPPGSVITKDGRIVDENGKPVLDANGNPMVAGPNYTIGPDGTLRDEKGNTVSQYRQLLADRFTGGDSGGGDDLLTPSHFGAGGFSYNTMGLGGSSGEGAGGLLAPGGGPMITGMGGGLSNRALTSNGDPNAMKAAVDQANAERAAAEKAARAAAQEQSLLTGRQTATSSGGMPPMMPPGGAGMGGQGGPNDKDRRRTTWLAEDEEVWGTETAAVHGVIGR
ncbi:hypothetical protein [Streptomyces sp. 1331.2]|uniref:hypothetical protein n=1 Tax=Streptomyces sp. 1331.2 TaxID=1938835 RepID=UPI000BC6E4F9|nr:hypothetical protein [Streptomyces sp. 1331.2]SOB82721.1 hypothetical protein SAMN06272789_2896 [Streptomyces sp. 1331.2]